MVSSTVWLAATRGTTSVKVPVRTGGLWWRTPPRRRTPSCHHNNNNNNHRGLQRRPREATTTTRVRHDATNHRCLGQCHCYRRTIHTTAVATTRILPPCPYDGYRHGRLTPPRRDEMMDRENRRTRDTLHGQYNSEDSDGTATTMEQRGSTNTARNGRNGRQRRQSLHQRLHDEIVSAAAWNDRGAIASERALGPTGLYWYGWVMDKTNESSTTHGTGSPHSSRRTYVRQPVEHDGMRQSSMLLSSSTTVLSVDWNRYSVEGMSLSVDERLLTYLVCDNRTGRTKVWIRHIESGTEVFLPLPKDHVVDQVEFGAVDDGNGGVSHSLIYVAVDPSGRPSRVYAVETTASLSTLSPLEQLQSIPGKLVFFSEDPTVHVSVRRTKGLHYVAIHAQTLSSNEVHLLRSTQDTPLLVRKRQDGVQYFVDVGSQGDVFCSAYREASVSQSSHPDDDPCLSHEHTLFESRVQDLPLGNGWGLIRSHPSLSTAADEENSFVLSDFELFRQYIVFFERSTRDGRQQIRVTNRCCSTIQKPQEWIVPLPKDSSRAACAMISPAGNMHYASSTVQFNMESPAEPRWTMHCNMRTRQLESCQPPPTAAVTADIHYRRVSVASPDGTPVPLSLVHARNTDDTVCALPLHVVLVGYGAYGEPMNCAYDPTFQPLLDRGYVIAFAHARGGGDLGRQWYFRGRGVHKNKGVEDYLACAEALVSGTILKTHQSVVELTAKGFSAGGIIVGAAVNRRPDLFSKVVLTNAFLDLYATMMAPWLPLTVHEWEEYGNPTADATAASSIASICPVQTVRAFGGTTTTTPSFLLIASVDDTQVPFWNAMIYGMKIRDCHPEAKTTVLMHFESTGGHELKLNRLGVAAMEATFIAMKKDA